MDWFQSFFMVIGVLVCVWGFLMYCLRAFTLAMGGVRIARHAGYANALKDVSDNAYYFEEDPATEYLLKALGESRFGINKIRDEWRAMREAQDLDFDSHLELTAPVPESESVLS